MKDTDARERVEKLEAALANLPAQIAEVVIAHFEPTLAQVNGAITAMDAQSARLEALAQRVAASGELLEVVESELNTMRVDINATREVTASLAESVASTEKRLDLFVSGLAGLASKAKS